VLVLLAGARGKDQGHIARRALPFKFKGKKVRDLSSAPIAATRKHVVAKQDVDERLEVALRRRGGPLCPQLAADALKLVLCIAVYKRVTALVCKLLLLALCIPLL
jgi:hypothetical protein